MRGLWCSLLLLAALGMSGACATTQARAKGPEASALDPPPPPPRVIAPLEPEEPLPASGIPEGPRTPPVRPAPRPAPPVRDTTPAGRGRSRPKPKSSP